jgi:hypothetical protein
VRPHNDHFHRAHKHQVLSAADRRRRQQLVAEREQQNLIELRGQQARLREDFYRREAERKAAA